MMYSIFIDPCNQSIRMIERSDLTGNTDWLRVELDDATAELLTRRICDDHGAPMYKWADGTVTERTLEERMQDWQPEPEPEATVDDYRDMLRELGVDV